MAISKKLTPNTAEDDGGNSCNHMKVYHKYTYEDSIMKFTKYCLKKWGGERRKWK
jgi:hypothetical protein